MTTGRPPQIVAFGGGGFSTEAGNPLLDDYVLSLAGRERPKVCFVPTASGDADHYVVRFYRTFATRCDTSHVSLFRRDRGGGAVAGDLEAHLLDQDVVYVGRDLRRVVSSRPRARAFRVEPVGDDVVESPLPVSFLGDAQRDLAAA